MEVFMILLSPLMLAPQQYVRAAIIINILRRILYLIYRH